MPRAVAVAARTEKKKKPAKRTKRTEPTKRALKPPTSNGRSVKPRARVKRAPKRTTDRLPPRLPLSGTENTFTDVVYGARVGGEDENNCYGFATDRYRDTGHLKLQPGNVSGLNSTGDADSCAYLRDRVLRDNKARGIYISDPKKPCKKGYYRFASMLAPGNDFHFARQFKDVLYARKAGETLASIARRMNVPRGSLAEAPDGLVLVRNANLWAHKQGFGAPPILVDSRGRFITDPRKAAWTYGDGLDYKVSCDLFCIKRRTPRSPL